MPTQFAPLALSAATTTTRLLRVDAYDVVNDPRNSRHLATRLERVVSARQPVIVPAVLDLR